MKRAFTLIELLVVIGIISLMSGMMFWTMSTSRSDAVLQEAERLARTLNQARLLALKASKAHGVTFNITNAGDGSVLRNFSEQDSDDFHGRHWYAIIGPRASRARYPDLPPTAESFDWKRCYTINFLNEYERDVQNAIVGQPYYLGRGTRFLALSDADRGRNAPSEAGYPRPWHGSFNPSTGRMQPWGGYHRDLETTTSSQTGLDYQGLDGIVPYDAERDTNVHPDAVWGQIHKDANACSPAEVGYRITKPSNNSHTLWSLKGVYVDYDDILDTSVTVYRTGPDTSVLPGTPRSLVEGWWCDYMILFDNTGKAYLAGGQTRKTYFKDKDGKGRYHLPYTMQHEFRTDGGYAITIARDVDPDDSWYGEQLYDWSDPDPLTGQPRFDRVPSAEAMLYTITPFARVFVPAMGGRPTTTTSDDPALALRPGDLSP